MLFFVNLEPRIPIDGSDKWQFVGGFTPFYAKSVGYVVKIPVVVTIVVGEEISQ